MRAKVAGVLAAAVALAVTQLVHAVFTSVPSLVIAVGQKAVRLAPGDASKVGIEAAGSADKPLVVICVVAVSLGIGGVIGPRVKQRARAGDVAFAAFGALGVAAVWSLPGLSVSGAVGSATAGAVTGALVLRTLLAATGPAPAGEPPLPGAAVGRRRFLAVSGAAAGGGAIALGGAWAFDRRGDDRDDVRLPPPSEHGNALPQDTFAVEGISPLITPNDAFYRIDEALVPPAVTLSGWRLRITGLVDDPLELTFDQLVAERLVEADITLACVSNQVGGSLVGTARWTGVRLADLLQRAGVQPGAEQVVGRSVDGFTVGFPVAVALDGRDALLAVAMNGETLPVAHGFPVRLVVPGLYGYVSATKWLTQLDLTTWDAFDAYWIERGWAKRAPIKVQSRIDVPRDYGRVASGRQPIAGVAWAPHRGIARVEVRVDGGPWREATLGPTLGDDAWRQWVLEWEAPAGARQLEARATTVDREVQTATTQGPHPDGATGFHKVHVTVV